MAKLIVGESEQPAMLSSLNPFMLRPAQEGAEGDSWLAAQKNMIEEQQKRKGVAEDVNCRLARIESILVETRDKGGTKARKNGRHRRKDEEEGEEEGLGGWVKACELGAASTAGGPSIFGETPTGWGHESIRNSSPSHPGK